MWFRTLLTIPLLVIPPTLMEDGCDGGGTPIPEPTPTPGPSGATDYEAFQDLLVAVNAAGSAAAKQTLVDDFFRQVAYSGGFPIRDGSSATFVMQASGISAPIRVAGDFNAWDANQHTLAQTPGFNLYYTTIDLTGAPDRSLYKFIGKSGGADTYVADPNARRFQYDEFGKYSLIDGGASASHLERYPLFRSPSLPSPRDLILYLPAGYEGGSGDLPVIYMHDGQNLFDPGAFWGGWQADDVADDMIRRGQVEPLVMVGLANTFDRMEEYTQDEDFIASAGGLIGGDGALYTDLLVDDVLPFIESKYRVSEDQGDRGVLGSSLGGLISYYIGWRHPDVFGFVGGMSSTFGWGKINLDNLTVIEMLAGAGREDQVFYLDSGGGAVGSCSNDTDGDGIWDDNSSASDNYCETLQMRSILLSTGYVEGQNLFYVHAPGAEHNEAEWHDRMDEALSAFAQR